MPPDQLKKMYVLRRILNPMGTIDAIDFLLDKLRNTKNNGEFFELDEYLKALELVASPAAHCEAPRKHDRADGSCVQLRRVDSTAPMRPAGSVTGSEQVSPMQTKACAVLAARTFSCAG